MVDDADSTTADLYRVPNDLCQISLMRRVAIACLPVYSKLERDRCIVLLIV